jgi:uncharacterized membrane protein
MMRQRTATIVAFQVEPTIENVVVLGVIVAVRTLLSFALDVEIERRLSMAQACRERSGRTRVGGP